MIAHTGLAVSDYRISKAFYQRALAPLGYKNNMEHGESGGFNDGKNTDFWIGQSDKVHPISVRREIQGRSPAFYETALEAGWDNGGPGYRKNYWPGYYAAFVYDPDGHSIEAVWYDYAAAK